MDKLHTKSSVDSIIESNNDLNLFLKWSTRDLLINLIQQFSALLMGKSMTNESKQRIKKENNNLILILSNLPMKLTNEEDDETPRKKIKLETDQYSPNQSSNQDSYQNSNQSSNQNSDELFLELKPETRLKIINHLITNKSYIIGCSLSCRSIKNELKMNLVKQNKLLINELLDLNVSTAFSNLIDDEDHLLFDEDCSGLSNVNKTNGNIATQLVNKNEMNNLVDDFKTEVSEIRSLFRTEVADFREKFDQFKNEISVKIEDSPFNRDSVEFTFILDDAENFMATSLPRYSEFFFCRSVRWCLSVQIMERNDINRTKFLGFYLRCENTGDLTWWKLDTEAELKLICQIPDIQNNYFGQTYNVAKMIKTTYARMPNNNPSPLPSNIGGIRPSIVPTVNVFSNGFNDFIALDKLRDFKNGFVIDNKIKFQVSLTASRFVRKG